MGKQEQTDTELLEAYKRGDSDALDTLFERYRNLVKRETREIYIIGADSEDLMQEGMIGLFRAVQDYQPDRNSSFSTFATLCVRRQLYRALESSNRKKHGPLNTYISFYSGESDQDGRLIDTIPADGKSDPETLVLLEERTKNLYRRMMTDLSRLEQQVLSEYLEGYSYTEIAKKLGKPEKSIDNAIQRIRKKLSDQ